MKDFIVAIELGSSKVTGIAGQKNLDGSVKSTRPHSVCRVW